MFYIYNYTDQFDKLSNSHRNSFQRSENSTYYEVKLTHILRDFPFTMHFLKQDLHVGRKEVRNTSI